VVYYDASVGKPIEGREEAKTGVIDNFLKAAPDAKWTVKGEPVVQGDRVAFEWEFSGTNSGEWADGTAATGKHFAFTGASVFTVKDGKIASQSDYYDALGFYKQLGLM
jgi:predicted ester cyclase